MDLSLVVAGLGVGFVVGLTGMGGGALMTPVLVLLFGVDPSTAVGSDLVASLVMKPVGGGVHLRRGTVNLRLVGWLVVGSVPSAFASVWVLRQLADPGRIDDLVKVAIGVALLLASGALAAKGAFSGRRREHAGEPLHIHPARTLAIGVFGGVMVGLTSVGSGSLMITLLLILYPAITARALVGTDLVQAIPLVGAAALGHALFGDVQLDLTGAVLVGALPGVYAGARISSRAPDHVIRPVLAVVLVASGLKMLDVPSAWVGAAVAVLTLLAVSLALRHRSGPGGPARPDEPGLTPVDELTSTDQLTGDLEL